MLQQRGLQESTARQVATELTEHDALAAHLSVELGISEADIANPWHAAFASAIAFTVGAILPMLAILLPPVEWRIPVTFVSVLLALALTGALAAKLGGSPPLRPTIRVVVGGALALGATFAVGSLLGTAGI
jgi:VIT1/CCC1 family predicted Fe2+/Mn2+ transporter